MYSARTVAQAFLELANNENKQLSNMQLQKLVFFAHGIYLAAEDLPLIYDDVMAWNFGPVIPTLYERLKKFGSGPVTDNIAESSPVFGDPEAAEIVKLTWNTFKKYSAARLSEISHAKNSPWDIVFNQQGRKFDPIPDDVVKKYYLPMVSKKNG